LIRDILRYGDPRLLAENTPIAFPSLDVPALIADMIETCHAAPGVGLAAPQVGVNLRAAIIDLSVGEDPGAIVTLINPEILETEGEQREEEGCLSVPDFVERVRRPARIRVRAADEAGRVREIEGTGLMARALSHEIDHLDGRLYLHRLRGLKRDLTFKKIERRIAKGIW
jgi:peptide deformylase